MKEKLLIRIRKLSLFIICIFFFLMYSIYSCRPTIGDTNSREEVRDEIERLLNEQKELGKKLEELLFRFPTSNQLLKEEANDLKKEISDLRIQLERNKYRIITEEKAYEKIRPHELSNILYELQKELYHLQEKLVNDVSKPRSHVEKLQNKKYQPEIKKETLDTISYNNKVDLTTREGVKRFLSFQGVNTFVLKNFYFILPDDHFPETFFENFVYSFLHFKNWPNDTCYLKYNKFFKNFVPEDCPHFEEISPRVFVVPSLQRDMADIRINEVRNKIIKSGKYWEKIHIAVFYREISTKNNMITFNAYCAISGEWATGVGNKPPSTNNYTDIGITYFTDLEDFANSFISLFKKYTAI